ncbi:Dihydrofolate reductase [Metarhizium rileyi]|uniref:Dihydrofolate reductase n=1 Tax=Metarhizium rileyi (strain RCEF 4871) TaxID=1649241 RepID=A0A166WBD5_METRR|nr:Dihydrofolate reductase [Metarhizium rileyi RCEF 4871]
MQPDLTLIVAATRSMGIGLNGAMPWTNLRKEMRYFARVTTRVAPQAPPGAVNAVIMGRKTWDSIPPRFRPLKNRLNIVISRQHSSAPAEGAPETVRASSLEQAVELARTHPLVSRVFVMGGGQIYDAALGMDVVRRVLLTRIEEEYECDTFFGLELGGEAKVPGWTRRPVEEWRDWTGEEGDGKMEEESGVRYEWQMWERE